MRADAARFERMRDPTVSQNDADALFHQQRLTNKDGVAEGIGLAPVLRAGSRITQPSAFECTYQEEVEGGTRFILSWLTPEDMKAFQPRFCILTYSGEGKILWAANQTVNAPEQAAPPQNGIIVDGPPADFVVLGTAERPVTFVLEMQLRGSGLIAAPLERPQISRQARPLEAYTRAVTAAYTATAKDRYIWADATSAAFTTTLPDLEVLPRGRSYFVKRINTNANNVTVQGFRAGHTIDGAATFVLTVPQSGAWFTSDRDSNVWRVT